MATITASSDSLGSPSLWGAGEDDEVGGREPRMVPIHLWHRTWIEAEVLYGDEQFLVERLWS